MLFYITPISSLFIGNFEFYNYELYIKYTFFVIIGLLLFLFGHCLTSSDDKMLYFYREEHTKYDFKRLINTVRLLLCFAIFIILILFIDAGTLNILSLGRIDLKNSGSILRIIANFGLYIITLLFFLVFLTLKRRSIPKNILWFVFFIAVEILIFVFYRTRTYLIAHSSAALIGYFYSSYIILSSNQIIITKQVSTTVKKFVILIAGIVVFLLSIILRFFRGFLQPEQNISDFNLDISSFLLKSIEMGDIGYTDIVINMFQLVPNQYEYLNGQSYYRIFFIITPRFIWPNKPHNTETIVGGWINPEIYGLSIPPGIIGDLYINFGLVGVVLMLIFGLFFSYIDKKMSLKNLLFWSVSATWVFHLVRGSFTNPLVIALILFIVVFFVNKYIVINSEINKIISGANK